MCIDNFSTSHGRQPTYDFGRKVLVAWSNPHDKTTSAGLSSPVTEKNNENIDAELLKKCCGILVNNECVPEAVAATPNSSPDSTLSSEEAQDLKDFIIEQGKYGVAKQSQHKRHISCPSPCLKSMFV